MRIDVIGAVLGVVLDHEDCSLLPQRAVADSLDQLAHRQVIGGDAGLRRKRPGLGAVGVVFAEAHDDEARHRAILGE